MKLRILVGLIGFFTFGATVDQSQAVTQALTVTVIPSSGACQNANADSGSGITVNYATTCGVMPPVAGYLTSINPYNGTSQGSQMQAAGFVGERTFWVPSCWSTGPGTFNFQNGTCNPGDYGDDGVLDNIISVDGAVPYISVGGGTNVGGGWEAKCSPGSGPAVPCNHTEYQNVLIGGLQHLASAFPSVTLIEDLNEPDCNGGGNGCDNGAWPLSTVVDLSPDLGVAINTVNAQLGTKHFLHGGPNPAFCQYFDIDGWVAGLVSAGTPPDFVSYHLYPQTDLTQCIQKVQSALANHGLSTNLLQVCSECSTDNSITGTAPQAAWFASNYWYATLANNFNARQYQWDRQQGYLDNPFNGCSAANCVGEAYNAALIFHKHKANRISPSAITGQASIYHPVATSDASGVALSLSTYQTTGTVTINLNNLPAAFSGAAFTWQEFLVSDSTSNWQAGNPANGALQTVASGTNPGASSWTHSVTISDPNTVLIFVLTHG
jgi:hypothetical protein